MTDVQGDNRQAPLSEPAAEPHWGDDTFLLRSIMTCLPAGVLAFAWDNPGVPLFINEQALRIYGLRTSDLAAIRNGERTFTFIPREELANIKPDMEGQGERPFEMVFRISGQENRPIDVRATCCLRSDAAGRKICYATVADVSEQLAEVRQQTKQEEVFKLLMDETRALIFYYDVEADTMEYSLMYRGRRRLLTRERFLAEFFSQTRTHPDYREEFLRRLREARDNQISDQFEFLGDFYDTGYRWYRAHYKSLVDAKGEVFQIIGRARDVTDEIEATHKLQLRADIDEMSGIYNRAKTVELVNARLAREIPGCKHTMMLFDIDRFKEINDTCGHLTGDDVIRSVANVMRSLFRSDDIIGRVGGDEFVVMATTPDNFRMSVRAERLQSMVRDISKMLCLPIKVSLSIGMAVAPEHGRNFQTLFDKADKALYAAKRGGRDRWVLYHEGL